jgi:hypothetical protein
MKKDRNPNKSEYKVPHQNAYKTLNADFVDSYMTFF